MTNGICCICGHSWRKHLHVSYTLEQHEDWQVDPVMQQRIKDTQNQAEQVRMIQNELSRQRKELEEEEKILLNVSAKFASFLSQHAIVPVNDYVGEYGKYGVKELMSV